MTGLSLKQFVPSTVCLKCDGCCRTKEADSIWRPKLGQEDQKGLIPLMRPGDILDAKGYITSIQACGQHFCQFLNGRDNTCGIYTQRPFECLLYPFILSQESGGVKVYVHLSCPYVQDHLPRPDYEEYVAYLKEFLVQADVKSFLVRNKAMFHDYSAYAPELLYLFDLAPL